MCKTVKFQVHPRAIGTCVLCWARQATEGLLAEVHVAKSEDAVKGAQE